MRLLPVVWLTACGASLAPEVRSSGDDDVPVDPTVADPTVEDPATSEPASSTTNPPVIADGDCPEGVICVDALPFVDTNTTTGGASSLDAYSCAPDTDESGPEIVYRVTLAEDGLLAASLEGLGAGVDVDVHLLEQRDSGACVDRGHWDSAAWLPAGTWWVVVDSWVDGAGDSAEGDYTLALHQTRPGDYVGEGIASDVVETALVAFDQAWSNGDTDRLEYGLIDFSLPSTEPRFFVMDLRRGGLLFAELTSHGSGSQDPNDLRMANEFSNISGSYMSSIGMMRGAETFYGDHGTSMRLDGLEPGFDDNVRSRAIIVHSADYATQSFVDTNGYLGRSQGCPAVDPDIVGPMMDTLSEGCLILSYYPDPTWLSGSQYLD